MKTGKSVIKDIKLDYGYKREMNEGERMILRAVTDV